VLLKIWNYERGRTKRSKKTYIPLYNTCHREKEEILKNFPLYIYIIIIIIIIRPFFSNPHHCWACRNYVYPLAGLTLHFIVTGGFR
jgi:hypothetical protein